MTTQEQNAPKYFADFVQENARQHQELSAYIGTVHQELSAHIGTVRAELVSQISEVKGEMRVIKAVGIAILVALLGLLGTGLTGLVTYFLTL